MLNKTCNVEKSSSDSSFINCRRGFARPPNSLRYYGPLIHFPQRKMPTSFDSSQRDLHEKFIKIGIAVPNKSWVAIFAVVEELTSLPWTRLKSTWSHGTKPNFWRLNPEKNHHLRKPLHRSSVENNGEKNQKWLHRTVMKSNANSIKPNETINFKGLDLQKKNKFFAFDTTATTEEFTASVASSYQWRGRRRRQRERRRRRRWDRRSISWCTRDDRRPSASRRRRRRVVRRRRWPRSAAAAAAAAAGRGEKEISLWSTSPADDIEMRPTSNDTRSVRSTSIR